MNGAAQAFAQGGYVLLQLLLGADDDLSRRRRGGGAQVGDEIADGEIGLMANGGDDRDAAGGDGARQGLIVEGGKVFDAASAARNDNDIDGEGGEFAAGLLAALLIEEAKTG